MSDRSIQARVFWTFAAGMTCAWTAHAVEPAAAPYEPAPSVLTTPRATEPSVLDAVYRPDAPSGSAVPASGLESAFRLRAWAPAGSRASEASVGVSAPASEPAAPVATKLAVMERSPLPPAGALEPVPIADQEPSQAGTVPFHPALNDRFFFGIGAYRARSNTSARLDSPSGIGTSLDVEEVMGLDSSETVPQVLARWRFSERWRLEFEYFALDRSSVRTIDGEIVWGDQTFPVNTEIHTQFDISVMRLSCGYSFFKTQDKELGVALGFHVTDVNIGLTSSTGDGDGGDVLAPLPVLSLYGMFALTDIWAVSGRMDVFRLAYDPFEGHVYSIGLDALCQPWRHFGFGVGWRSLEIEFSATANDWEGELNTSYQGPIVFISTSF